MRASSNRSGCTWPLLLALAALGAGLGALAPASAAPSYEHAAAAEGLLFARAGDRLDPDINFVEISGGGACWLDADADGDLDVFLVNGWYNDSALAAARQPHSMLYRNDGPRAGPDFVDATAASGLGILGWTQACAAADYDADGLEDLLVVGHGIQSLFHNRGDGTFANVSAASGITAAGKCGAIDCWGSGAAWADYDRDGCLDVYVINFVAYPIVDGGTRGPGRYDGQPNQLYRNRCDGTFADVTAEAGADGDPDRHHSKNWGVTWLDYDLDGWLDIYVASDGVPNILYRNQQNGTFVDLAVEAGVADERNGMGLAANDCDDDGDEDLFFTHYSSPPDFPSWGWDGFYWNEGNGTFTDHSGEGDLRVTEPYVKWGVDWQDLDNDGDLDLHVLTGHTENDDDEPVDQPHLLWTGDGACHYTDARAAAGAAIATARNSRGSAYADWDLDGTLDLLAVNIVDETTELLRGTGSDGHWLTLELRQPGGNPRAVGAEVRVELPGGKVLRRNFMPYSGVHGSNAAQLHIGLGAATTADVEVTWPGDRAVTRFEGLPGDNFARLHRAGAVQLDLLAPVTGLVVASGGEGIGDWHRAAVTVSLDAADRGAGAAGPSGVAHRYVSLDGAPAVEDPGPLALAEGPHVLRWWSVDAAGNAERPRTAFVGRDNTPPASTATLDGTLVGGWYQGPARVTLACADGPGGPDRIEWRLDGGAWTRYAGPFDLTRPGAHAFGWRCVDLAGNVEAEQSLGVAIDLGRPETLARLEGPAGAGGWWRGAVTVTLDAAGGPRAVAETLVGVDGGPLAPAAGPVLLGADGLHVVRFRSTDVLGNAEPEQAVEVRIDATPPALRLTDTGPHVEADWAMLVGPRHRLGAASTDAGAGPAGLDTALDWEPFRPARDLLLSEAGLHRFALRGADAAGNPAERTRDVYLDLEAPSIGVVRPWNNTVHLADELAFPLPANPSTVRAVLVGGVTVEAEVGEDLAGIAVVRFLVDGVPVGEARQAPWTWRWDLPPGAASRGYHRLTFEVEDGVGNVNATTFDVLATGDPLALLPLEAGMTPWPALLAVSLAATAAGRRKKA